MQESDLWPALRAFWHPVAFAEDIKEKPIALKLLDEPIVVCRMGSLYAAYHDLCIHRGTPLSLGWIEGGKLICAYHGWAYDADGKCVRIPSVSEDHPIPKKACLTTYRVQERYGMIWVCMSDDPRAPIPEFPLLEDQAFKVVVRDQRIWQCSAARTIENFVDLAHFPWVHEGILGNRSHPHTPDIDVKRHGEELRFQYTNLPDKTHAVSFKRTYRLFRPFAIYLEKEESDGRNEVLVFVCTPHSAGECTRYFVAARNYEPKLSDGGKQEEIYDLLTEQDRVIVENQRPEELPLDLAEEMHLKGPDGVSLAYRQFIRELGVF